MEPTTESSTNDDLRRLFEILEIDIMAECRTALFPAFKHGYFEKEDTLQSIYTYASTAYKRSEVPIHERLTLPENTFRYSKNIDDIIKGLLKIEG
ncbi:hypothetical protein DPMN_095574, partial [Dreissena polymorpha]